MKGIAPSHELRKWFDHEPNKWEEFREKYRKELFGSKTVGEMIQLIRQHETVTLIYASRDEKHNSTMVFAVRVVNIYLSHLVNITCNDLNL